MEEQYIDPRNNPFQYEKSVARLQNDPQISEQNKTLILRFLRDAALGKTIIGRAKKKIGPSRLIKYIIALYPLMTFLKKDLDKITQEEMENFIEALESDRIRSRKSKVCGKKIMPSGDPLCPRYKADIKKIIKKFYKWLWGESKVYPKIVEWIDTYIEEKEVSALTETEVEKLVDRAKTTQQRAIIQVLFDGGFRVGELVNIRLHHVRCMSYDPDNPNLKCFVCRVPFSKTLRRTVALPMHATTKWLELWLKDHPAQPMIAGDGTLTATDMSMQLFPKTDNAIRLMLNKLGKQALAKRVYPHLLRHTSATYWSNKLPYFKFCKRFGWSMTSKMPQRYIDREGVDELSVAKNYHEQESDRVTTTTPPTPGHPPGDPVSRYEEHRSNLSATTGHTVRSFLEY